MTDHTVAVAILQAVTVALPLFAIYDGDLPAPEDV